MTIASALASVAASIASYGTAATKNVGTGSGDVAAGNRGMPTGGADGDVLTKTSGTDYAVAWETPSTAAAYVPAQIDLPFWAYTASSGTISFPSGTNYVQIANTAYVEWPVLIPVGTWRVTVFVTANGAGPTGQVAIDASNLGSTISGTTVGVQTVDADYTEPDGDVRTLRITAGNGQALRVSGIALTKQ